MTRWSFRPPVWALVLTVAAVAAFASLGAWQLQRGAAKAQLLQHYVAVAEPSLELSAATPAAQGLAVQRAKAHGHFVPERELQLDGQSHASRPGRHVWTPLELGDGAWLIVDLGWIPLDAAIERVQLRDLPELTGFWRALPRPALRLAQAGNCPAERKFPAVVQYPTHADLECLLGHPVLDGLLQLDANLPGGYVREWQDTGFPPERHYGYAVQWFALGLTALVLFIVLNLKRLP